MIYSRLPSKCGLHVAQMDKNKRLYRSSYDLDSLLMTVIIIQIITAYKGAIFFYKRTAPQTESNTYAQVARAQS